MANRRPAQQPQRSENRADYQIAFLQRVHRLIQLAYESLAPGDYENAEEDDITGELCKHMKHLTEIAPSEKWMARFSIHDQDPSNDVPSPETGKIRKGKRRPKIDVRLVCKHRTPNRGYCVEAKRLYRSDSVSEYVDDEGIGAFISGDYAKDDDFGGMVGYVQTDSVATWLPKLEAKLAADPSLKRSTKGNAWEKTEFTRGPKICFQSSHEREGRGGIVIIHIILPFLRS